MPFIRAFSLSASQPLIFACFDVTIRYLLPISFNFYRTHRETRSPGYQHHLYSNSHRSSNRIGPMFRCKKWYLALNCALRMLFVVCSVESKLPFYIFVNFFGIFGSIPFKRDFYCGRCCPGRIVCVCSTNRFRFHLLGCKCFLFRCDSLGGSNAVSCSYIATSNLYNGTVRKWKENEIIVDISNARVILFIAGELNNLTNFIWCLPGCKLVSFRRKSMLSSLILIGCDALGVNVKWGPSRSRD